MRKLIKQNSQEIHRIIKSVTKFIEKREICRITKISEIFKWSKFTRIGRSVEMKNTVNEKTLIKNKKNK